MVIIYLRTTTLLAFTFLTGLVGGQNLLQDICSYDDTEQIKDAVFEKVYQKNFTTWQPHKSAPVYTVTVVFHIIHSGQNQGTELNPDNETVQRVLLETSDRFRHQHATAALYDNPLYGTDTEIELCLASLDPDGNPTKGVYRYYNPDLSSGDYTDPDQELAARLINEYGWDQTYYLNIYLLENLTNAAGVYLGGFGRDFIILESESFWSGLMAHEIGHYFSLNHIFAPDGNDICPLNGNCLEEGDKVCDTPPKDQSGRNEATCDQPDNSCQSDTTDFSINNPYRPVSMGGMGDQPDMLANYMDYTGNCWDSFTEGQKVRMRTDIEINRMPMITEALQRCNSQIPLSPDLVLLEANMGIEQCQGIAEPSILIKNEGTDQITEFSLEVAYGEQLMSFSFSVAIDSGARTVVPLESVALVEGIHNIEFEITTVNGMQDGFVNDNTSNSAITYLPDGLTVPFVESFGGCEFPALFTDRDQPSTWDVSTTVALGCKDCFIFASAFSQQDVSSTFCLPPMDLTNIVRPELTFEVGYIPRYDFIINELSVSASLACGDVGELWRQSGLTLATNDPAAFTDGIYKEPACGEFKTISIDLGAFAGEKQVDLCFESFGRWFSPVLLDNITVEEAPLSTCREMDSLTLVSIYTELSGPDWRVNWNLQQPINTWFGISLDDDGCVRCIDLDGINDCMPSQGGGNGLAGNIPTAIGNLESLELLFLGENDLTGSLPPELGQLINLIELDLHGNGFFGSIPDEIFTLVDLVTLDLSENSLNGDLSEQIGDLINLEVLDLGNNQLTGELPPTFGNLTDLVEIILSNNGFSEMLPSELTILERLAIIDLSNNNLSGCFELSYFAFCVLGELDPDNGMAQGYLFTGNALLPWQGDLFQLCNGHGQTGASCNDLDMSTTNDRINGNCECLGDPFFPVNTCRLRDSLALVAFYNNTGGPGWNITWDLEQPIHNWFGVSLNENGCVDSLVMNGDIINGELPNNLLGSLPPEIGNLVDLTYLLISQEPHLIGEIPVEIGHLVLLQTLRLQHTGVTGNLPVEIGELTELRELCLRDNDLTGNIPESIGELDGLNLLCLDQNNFTGNIPASLGNLTNLFILWLDNNLLDGEVPGTFTNLINLGRFSLSQNNLSGDPVNFLPISSDLHWLFIAGNLFEGNTDFLLNYPILSNADLSNNNFSGCFNENLISVCAINYNFENNPLLPWEGDFSRFCIGENPIGAFCDDRLDTTVKDVILDNCTCAEKVVIPLNPCRKRDSLALVALYERTDGPNWTQPWDLALSYVNWYGISTNVEGCVVNIELSGNGLAGILPPELGMIENRRIFDFSNNDLQGELPEGLFVGATTGFNLNVSYNQLIGCVPDLSDIVGRYLEESETNAPGSDILVINTNSERAFNFSKNNFGGNIPEHYSRFCEVLGLLNEPGSDGNTISLDPFIDLSSNPLLAYTGDFTAFCSTITLEEAACDDADDFTVNDVTTDLCSCAGTPLIMTNNSIFTLFVETDNGMVGEEILEYTSCEPLFFSFNAASPLDDASVIISWIDPMQQIHSQEITEISETTILGIDEYFVFSSQTPVINGTWEVVVDIMNHDTYFASILTETILVNRPDPMMVSHMADNETNCDEVPSRVEILIGQGAGPFAIAWADGITEEVRDDLLAGEYQLTVTDANNCMSAYDFTLSATSPLVAEVESFDPLCESDDDGIIFVRNINGGTPPYQFQLNENVAQSDSTFSDLGPGIYQVILKDDRGCTVVQQNITIRAPEELNVDAGNLATIDLGDSLIWLPVYSFDPEHIEVNPNRDYDLGSDGSFIFFPEVSTNFEVTSFDSSGCLINHTLYVTVEKEDPPVLPDEIYVANVIAPNSAINDCVEIFSPGIVNAQVHFSIHDRWGGLVHHTSTAMADRPTWCGLSSTGRMVASGVYVYMLRIENNNGLDFTQSGSITVLQ